MILTLAVSDKDITQALRLMRWIGFLSSRNDNSMLEESCLIVASRKCSGRKALKEICWLAAKIFREARCFVPETEHEVGWPGAANFMFSQCLLHVEQHFADDIFFLEPDGIPLCPEWYDVLQGEFEVARKLGKSFMGASVPHTVTHMTGIAVYGRDWRELAPTLVECPDHDAFDCYGAPKVIPHAHLVPLIQHVFRRHDPGWRVPHLGLLDKRAVVFHQDKKGLLFPMLDNAHFNGECSDHPLFGYKNSYDPEKSMRKFYYAENATKTWKMNGYTFNFDRLEPIAGSVPGVFTTEFEAEQDALFHLASLPSNGIREILVEEWEALTKKKWEKPIWNTSKPSKETYPGAPILPTPSQSPAALVAEPTPQPTSLKTEAEPIKDINTVLKTGTVQAATVKPPKSTRPRKAA